MDTERYPEITNRFINAHAASLVDGSNDKLLEEMFQAFTDLYRETQEIERLRAEITQVRAWSAAWKQEAKSLWSEVHEADDTIKFAVGLFASKPLAAGMKVVIHDNAIKGENELAKRLAKWNGATGYLSEQDRLGYWEVWNEQHNDWVMLLPEQFAVVGE